MANGASCNTVTLVNTAMVVSGAVSGTILAGMTVTGAGVPRQVTVVSQSSGTTGQAGTYVCTASTANVSAQEPMVFSLDWNYPLIGNSALGQLVDIGLAAGFTWIIASNFTGGTAAFGHEYQHGTHANAIYDSQAISGSHIWPIASTKQGTPIANVVLTSPQYVDPPQPSISLASLTRVAKFQPLQMAISAGPQFYDPTSTMQPSVVFITAAQTPLGFNDEYQYGSHAKAIYDSQNSSIIWSAVVKPPVATNVPSFTVFPQETYRDLTIQGSIWSASSLPQGWVLTMITSGPQLADLTLQAQISQARPFQSAFLAPWNPTTIVGVWQADPTQITPRVIKPPIKASPIPIALQTLTAAPTPQEQFTQQQIQPILQFPAVPGPSNKVQPVTIWVYEQQYDRTNYPQVIIQAQPAFVPPPPVPAPVIPAPTISEWTTDATQVTADTINFTADGSNLIAGGGLPTDPTPPQSGGPTRDVSQNLRF